MHNLKEGIISITNRCNLHCKMCDIPLQKHEELATYQWKEIISDFASLGAETVVFSGGEPLLRKDLLELIAFAKESSLKVCITSNGVMINKDLAKELSEAGVDVINISIDGLEVIHDYLRGEGNFNKALEALKYLKINNIELTIATMVSRYNYKDLVSIVNLAKNLGVTTIKLQPFNSLFLKDEKAKADFFINSEDIDGLKNIIKDVYLKCIEYGIAINPREYLERLPVYLSNKFLAKSKFCPALYSSLPLNAKGEFYPCWVNTQESYLIADLSKERLINVWGKNKHRRVIKNILDNGCFGCAMSCYDGNFKANQITDKIKRNIGAIKTRGLFVYAEAFYRKLRRKVSFYSSYRGSAKEIIRRIAKFFVKKSETIIEPADKNSQALNEIDIAIKILKKEIGLRK